MKNIDSNIYEWRDKRGEISANALKDFSKDAMIKKYINYFVQQQQVKGENLVDINKVIT